MEPKFQSSFIPKEAISQPSQPGPSSSRPKVKERNLVSFIALIIFLITIVLGVGIYGYKYYLQKDLANMRSDLENRRAQLVSDSINKFVKFNNQIISVNRLVNDHLVLTPLFEYLEQSTLKQVRFSDFEFSSGGRGGDLTMRGQAIGYSILAVQADIFNRSVNFNQPVFSNLDLDDKSNVIFQLKMGVNPELVSYRRLIEHSETSRETLEVEGPTSILPAQDSSSSGV
jgi:hypothetical protein